MTKVYGASVVASLYLALVSTSILGDIFYWIVSKVFAGYAKPFFYFAILIVFIDLVLYKKLVNGIFQTSLAWCAILGLLLGIYNNPIGKEFFAHFSPFVLAIAAYSYGYRSEVTGGGLIRLIDKYIIRAGYVLVLLVFLYFLLVRFGYIEYFGAGALFAYPVFFCLKNKYYYHAFVFYVANVFTGKRSVLMAITAVILIYFFKKIGFFSRFAVGVFMVVFVFFVVSAASESEGILLGGELDRYLVLFQFLAEQEDVLKAIDLATSGRLYDAIAVVDRLGGNYLNWIFGLGFGATFPIDYSFADETHVTHYSHVTPFSYLLIGGVVLLVVVYGKLLFEARCAVACYNDHLAMMVIYFLIIGFSGAIFFTDTFVWILIGAFSGRRFKEVNEARYHNCGGLVINSVGK